LEDTRGYSKLITSGEIIDPTNQIIENGVIDPDKYLREFNYGRISTLDNGTVLRELPS
jgi:hypothetical protein